MLFEEFEVTEAQLLQHQRRESFGALTAKQIGAAENCLFSLLPSEELARLAAGWYEGCAQAMLHGNFAVIDQWIRCQSDKAAAEGFGLEDVLELLRLCRSCAIEVERWNADSFSEVDAVINEALGATSSWTVPPGLDYTAQPSGDSKASMVNVETEEQSGERRTFGRNRLQLPIRVCGVGDRCSVEEVSHTESISRGGLYFVTQENYRAEQVLKVFYPYWSDPGAINREYSAKVVRVDLLPDRTRGVAIHFLDGPGGKSK